MDRHFYRAVLLSACCCAVVASYSAAQAPIDQIHLTQFDERPAAAEFPYVAFVTGGEALVRSGPGQRHYPTERLPVGSAVEVFRHDGQRWCAVRPPQGAYSLVATRQLRKLDDRTAEVIEEGAVARVGSSLSPQKNGVQVLLKLGELVQLARPPIGSATTSDNQWTRIAPPAGEFRWVAANQISRQPPVEEKPVRQKPVEQKRGHPPLAGGQGGLSLASLPTLPASAVVRIPAAAPSPGNEEQVEVIAGSPAALQLAQHEGKLHEGTSDERASDERTPYRESGANGSPAESPAATTHAAGAPPRIKFPHPEIVPPANPRIAELQVRLSREVVKPPTTWSLVALREETAVLLANEQEAPAREQYRDLLNRIAVFEQVQRRYTMPPVTPNVVAANSAASTTSQTDAVRLPEVDMTEEIEKLVGSGSDRKSLAHTSGSKAVLARIRTDLGEQPRKPAVIGSLASDPFEARPSETPPFETKSADTAPTLLSDASDPAAEAKYDAVGTLKPVVSRREGAPRYALVDEKGDVVSFVTPSPDVNLQRYVGRRIGIQGARGFMPDYHRSHVTASRVNMLGTTRR